MIAASQAIEALETTRSNPPTTHSTGFTRVDDVTGGFASGQVWIIVGTPGQGRSTLATQWALLLADQIGMRTDLISLRDPEHRVAVRLLACAGKVPVPHLWRHELTDLDHERLRQARGVLHTAPLQIAGPGRITMLDADLDDYDRPDAVVADDLDLAARVFPDRIASFAAAGVLVVLTLPHHHVVSRSSLDPGWARVADFIIEISRPDLLDWNSPRPGEADLRVLKNRWGPQLETRVGFQGHYARFVDMASSP